MAPRRLQAMTMAVVVVMLLLSCLVWQCDGESVYQKLKRNQQQKKDRQQERTRRLEVDDAQRLMDKERIQQQMTNRFVPVDNVQYIEPPVRNVSAIPRIQNLGSVLFVGTQHVRFGSMFDHGFVDLFESIVKESGFKDVAISSVSNADLNAESLEQWFHDQQSPKPVESSIAVLVLDNDNRGINSDEVDRDVRRVERIVAFFVRKGMGVLLVPLFLDGERHIGEADSSLLSPFIQTWRAKCQLMSISYDNVWHLDLYDELVRYWTAHNIDNNSHSVLTLDGQTLNDQGHAWLARQLLQTFGVIGKSSIKEVTAVDSLEYHQLLTHLDQDKIMKTPLWDKLIDFQAKKQKRASG